MTTRPQQQSVPPRAVSGEPSADGQRRLAFVWNFLGGWVGVATLAASLAIALGLLLSRDRIDDLGQLGLVGVALIAFFGNAPLVPVFPWLVLIAPLGAVYPVAGIVIAGSLGAGVGEAVPYLVGTNVYNTHKAHPWIARLGRLPGWMRVCAVFLLSLSPVLSFPGLASGVLRVPFWAMLAMKVATEALKLWLVLQAVSFAKGLFM